jgi:1-acyl-sn-glycerol-3-phosphate acyltransferase
MVKTVFLFIYVAAAAVYLLLFAIIYLIFSLFGLRKPMTMMLYRVAQCWSRSLIKLTGCKVTVSGRENIPRSGGICFVSNHGSIFDVFLALAYCGRPFGFIAKKELIKVPFINLWILLLGGFFVDRNNARSAVKTINKGVEKIQSGGAMIIFPEGRRSKGEGLLPFRRGSLKLATKAKAPIVPMAISGSYDVFEKTKLFVSGPIGVSFCEPVYTEDMPSEDRKQYLCDKIYSIIKEKLDSGNGTA